jgi:hypothetical protein
MRRRTASSRRSRARARWVRLGRAPVMPRRSRRSAAQRLRRARSNAGTSSTSRGRRSTQPSARRADLTPRRRISTRPNAGAVKENHPGAGDPSRMGDDHADKWTQSCLPGEVGKGRVQGYGNRQPVAANKGQRRRSSSRSPLRRSQLWQWPRPRLRTCRATRSRT